MWVEKKIKGGKKLQRPLELEEEEGKITFQAREHPRRASDEITAWSHVLLLLQISHLHMYIRPSAYIIFYFRTSSKSSLE